ncbi:MAG: polysaccharide deacetylase family protein [Haliea sp.]
MSAKELDSRYLEYPHRSYGMDHDRYTWSLLADRKSVCWPGNRKLALWVNVNLQFFPLDQKGIPFKVPGGMTMPYPDLRHFSLRDYGNRVGIFRFLQAFDKYNITPTFACNAELAQRIPYLFDAIKERRDEILCQSWNMDTLHFGGQDIDEERERVQRSLHVLRERSGQDIKGWVSPARNESSNTPELLAENGVEYFCDWVNDDMPYEFNTQEGKLTAMPLSNELDDHFILMNNLHSEDSYMHQICDAADFLLSEADTQGGRILSLNIHPWILGQPHRIGKLEAVLDYLSSNGDIWSASAADILQSFREQQ